VLFQTIQKGRIKVVFSLRPIEERDKVVALNRIIVKITDVWRVDHPLVIIIHLPERLSDSVDGLMAPLLSRRSKIRHPH
jgi:hypothetical protein